MALQVWLPLNGNIKNQGLSDLSFSVVSSNTSGSTSGKIGSCYYNSSHTEGGLTSNKTINLGSQQSMFCWVKFDRFYESASLTGVIGQHRYQKNTGMGITTYRISETTAYLSVNTGTGSNRTFNDYRGNTVINANQWYHVGYTFDGSTIRLYVNGNLDGTFTGHSSQLNVEDYIGIFMWSLNDSTITNTLHANYKLKGYLNDVRIYNHCLSPKEVKEISKGLVLHYKMDDPCINKNVSIDPAFNGFNGGTYTYDISTNTYTITSPVTSSTWGSGVCIKDPQITVPWGSSYRCSFEALVPTAHDIQIDYNNYLADGNYTGNDNDSGRITSSFSIPANTWTKVVIGATNANSANTGKASLIVYDAIGLKTNNDSASVTWYIRNVKSEITNDPSSYSKNSWSDNMIYDYSGFGYNGTVTSATAPILGSDSPRHNSCFNFDTAAKCITTAIDPSGYKDTYSIAWWGNIPSFGGAMFWGFSNMMNWYDGKYWNQGDGGNNPFYSSGTTTITPPSVNTWHHYVITGNGSATKLYVDGVLYGTAKTYRAIGGSSLQISGWPNDSNYRIPGMKMSDFRIYATPLSAEDVKELYNTSAIVCDNGTVMAYSLEE